jgi:hypothetical protein
MKREATMVKIIVANRKYVGFLYCTAMMIMLKRDRIKKEANHRQSRVPGRVPSL